MFIYRWLLLATVVVACLGCAKQTSNTVSIGRDPTWYPLDLGTATINVNAFTNALIQAINKSEKLNLHLVEEDWEDLTAHLKQQTLAGMLTTLPPLPMYQEQYDFSDPLLLLGPVLVVRSTTEATSLEDLKGKIVAVNQYDNTVLIVQKYPSLLIQYYQNVPQALEALAAGNIDALLVATLDAHALVPHLYPGILQIVSKPLNDSGLRLVTLKNTQKKLLDRFNKGLIHAEKSGLYNELRTNFGVY